MFRINFTTFGAVLILSLGAAASSQADFFVGNGVSAAAAGTGTWDNTTVNWSSTSGGLANIHWTNDGNAVFQGAVGGTVTTGADLSASSVTFSNNGVVPAGAFTVVNNNNLTIDGAGVSNNTAATQTISNGGTLNFNGSASASAGTAPVTYENTSLLNFNGTTHAGTAAITNDGTMTFNNSSSADSASITNDSILLFTGAASGGSAAITNNSTMDISGVTTGITTDSVDNAGSLTLGQGTGGVGKTLAVVSLTLEGNSEFAFTLGSTSSKVSAGSITVDGSVDPADPITLDISPGTGLSYGTSYTLIDFTGGGNYAFDLSDYTLGLPTSLTGSYLVEGADGHSLDLVAVPEVSSFAIPIIGAAGLLWLRRRRSASAFEAPSPAVA